MRIFQYFHFGTNECRVPFFCVRPPLAVTSSTVVSCAEIEGEGEVKLMDLRTAADIEIELLVPNENFVPPGVLRRAGNFVMQRVVDIGLPQVHVAVRSFFGDVYCVPRTSRLCIHAGCP